MEATRNVQIGGAIAAMAIPDDSTNAASNLFMMAALEKRASSILSHSVLNAEKRLDQTCINGRIRFSWDNDPEGMRSLLVERGDGPQWTLILALQYPDHILLRVGAHDLDAARRTMEELKTIFVERPPTEKEVKFIFWCLSADHDACWQPTKNRDGKMGRNRRKLRTDDRGRNRTPDRDGTGEDRRAAHPVAWRTGNRKDLRAAFAGVAWRKWCRFEYVIDPEALFGNGHYLQRVLLADDDDEIEDEVAANFAREGQLEWRSPNGSTPGRKWRLLVLEDTGELVSMDAKRQVGQALSRLLNLSEGILGQGTRLLVLITTNEELGKVHPAVSRPGRCLSRIQFRRLPADQARNWLQRNGSDAEITSAVTLSELYAISSGEPIIADDASPLGFRQQHNGAAGKAG